MRHQSGEFRRGQAQPGFGSPPDLLFRGQRLEFAVQPAFGDEVLDHPGVHGQQAGRIGTAGAHQIVLVLVVDEHQPAHLVGHRQQHLGAVVGVDLAGGDQ